MGRPLEKFDGPCGRCVARIREAILAVNDERDYPLTGESFDSSGCLQHEEWIGIQLTQERQRADAAGDQICLLTNCIVGKVEPWCCWIAAIARCCDVGLLNFNHAVG